MLSFVSSSEISQIDPNIFFFDASCEAAQLQFDIAEKALGIETLLAAADDEELEDEAIKGMSEDELSELFVRDAKTGFVPEYIDVGIMVVHASFMPGENIKVARGFELMNLTAGALLLSKIIELDKVSTLHKVIEVHGNRISTKITQQNVITNFRNIALPQKAEVVKSEITLDDANVI